jgi:MFS family permease
LFLPLVIATGLSSVGWNSISLVLVTEISAKNRTATSVGLASTIGWSGLFLGPVGFGSLTDHFGYSYAWISLAVFCFFSFILSFLMPVSTRDSVKLRNW